jgi:hypothetical protein
MRHTHAAATGLHCAGGFLWGNAGSNECPTDATQIVDEAACRSAAIATEKPYAGVSTIMNQPKGCYLDVSASIVYLNAHSIGAGNAWTLLLCAACPGCTSAPTGTPPSRAPTLQTPPSHGTGAPIQVCDVFQCARYLTGLTRSHPAFSPFPGSYRDCVSLVAL